MKRSTTLLFVAMSVTIWMPKMIYSQIPTGSSARTIPKEIERVDGRIARVIARAETYFKEGELHLIAGERQIARDKFDKAVDSVLESGLDVRVNQRLQTFYLDLVERIYRLEVPSPQLSPRPIPSMTEVAMGMQSQKDKTELPQIGFREHKFEPSPLDELSRLTLLPNGRASNSQESTQFRASIRLRDGTTVKGKVQRMTSTEIEILEDQATSLRVIERKRIASIDFIEEAQEKADTPQTVDGSPGKMTCGNTPVPIPEVRGFRFGMSFEEFKKMPLEQHALFFDDIDEIGVRDQYLSRIALGFSNEQFKGLDRVQLKFLDDHLAELTINYDSSVKWPNALEFTAAIADALKLPRQGWKGRQSTILDCNEFRVETSVNIIGHAQIMITKQGLVQEIAQRRKQKEQKQRETFKP